MHSNPVAHAHYRVATFGEPTEPNFSQKHKHYSDPHNLTPWSLQPNYIEHTQPKSRILGANFRKKSKESA